jgi:hypothetical protein
VKESSTQIEPEGNCDTRRDIDSGKHIQGFNARSQIWLMSYNIFPIMLIAFESFIKPYIVIIIQIHTNKNFWQWYTLTVFDPANLSLLK